MAKYCIERGNETRHLLNMLNTVSMSVVVTVYAEVLARQVSTYFEVFHFLRFFCTRERSRDRLLVSLHGSSRVRGDRWSWRQRRLSGV